MWSTRVDVSVTVGEGNMVQQLTIDAMRPSDWSAVRSIYRDGLATGLAAFMLTPPNWKDWNAGHLQVGRQVARQSGDIVGWSALAPVADT